MGTNKNRAKYNRDKLRYPSDVTDEEWAHVEPLIPPGRRGGRKREANMREVLNGIMFVLDTGCQWRYIPKDLPPKSTIYRYFCDGGWSGALDRIHDVLYEKCRDQAERRASSSNSRERLDTAYPRSIAIEIILDNHSAHTSKETKAWLARACPEKVARLFRSGHAPTL